MPAPSLCGNFLTNKRSLIAFTWTLTTVLTLVAFIMALAMTIHTHVNYKRLEHQRQEQYNKQMQNYYNDEVQEGEHGGGGHSADREYEQFMLLSQMNSKSMTFVALYTMSMAVALALYGSTAIVGFTSLRGVYIAPCFSYPTSSRFKVGIFGGAIIFFANLLLVCAVIFGEVRVEDWRDNRDQDNNNNNNNNGDGNDREPYEVERIATILAVTCMFLSALYTIFAILLFLYYGSEDNRELDDDVDGVVVVGNPNKLQHHMGVVGTDPRRENFITIGGT